MRRRIIISGKVFTFFPLFASALVAALLVATEFDSRIVLAVVGLTFGITAYLGNHFKSYLENRRIRVWVLTLRRGAGSERRIGGVQEALADTTSISLHVVRPERSDVSSENWSTAEAAWLRKALLSAVANGADFLVIDSAHRVIGDVGSDLLEVAESGRTVILIGDLAFPPTRALNHLCIVKTDAAAGGFEIGQAVMRFLKDRPEAHGVLIVRSFPTLDRPRAAYAALALSLAGEMERTTVLTADNLSDLDLIRVKIDEICDTMRGDVVVACTTDAQLVVLSRSILKSLPQHRDRLAFIGYDGTLDENGELLVESSPLRVLGTVDAKPSELGRLAGNEILRRIGRVGGRVEIVVSPEFRSVGQ